MDSGIYKILNKTNNKVYIGSSITLKNREYKHFWMLRNCNHDNKFLQNSFNRDGVDNFLFEVIELCNPDSLIERENYYIDYYNSNKPDFGYNMAKVNEFRRNTYNDDVKLNLSKSNLKKNGHISHFNLIGVSDNKVSVFDNLFEAARYLIDGGFTNGSERNVRQKISQALRGKKINNGYNGSIRKTIYKHHFETINY